MGREKNKKNKKLTSKRFFALAVFSLIILFLALPLIFQKDSPQKEEYSSQVKALPIKTENPFTHYLNLLKNFYTPNKNKRDKKHFSKTQNLLLAKNTATDYQDELPPTLSPQATPTASLNKEEGTTSTSDNYYAQETAENPFYNLLQEPAQPYVEQQVFNNILIEGLYETSHTDPYEVKQAAKKTLFDIFSPRKRLALLNTQISAEPLLVQNNSSTLPQTTIENNSNEKEETSLFNINVNTPNNLKGTYNYGSLDSFNINQILGQLDIKGLSFDEQANLVTDRLNAVRQINNFQQAALNHSGGNNNHYNQQHNGHPNPPLPPKDTFDPNKWDKQILSSCSMEDPQEEQTQTQKNTESKSEKIDTCDPELNDKLDKVSPNMQKEYTYLLVSGRYKGKIMIPAKLSLSDRVLSSISADEWGIETLRLPKDLNKNTEKTEFEFVSALKPQAFENIMKEDKIILLSVDEEDIKKYPEKTILIQSGEIETYSGANKIIKDINNFPAKIAALKILRQKQEQEDKDQKAQNLQQKINSSL